MTAPALRKVLLVDDDKVTNLMHGRLFRRSGLVEEVDVATDGRAALDYLVAQTEAGAEWPELILLDINMPRMNGFEFLEGYASLPDSSRSAKTLIIMLSTSVLRTDRERAEADPHVHAFVSKPMQSEHIAGFIEACQSLRDS